MPRARFKLIRVWGEPGETYDMRLIKTARQIRYAKLMVLNRRQTYGPNVQWEQAIALAAQQLNVSCAHLRNIIGRNLDSGTPCWLAIHPDHVNDFYMAGGFNVRQIEAAVRTLLDDAPRDPVTGWPAIGWSA